MSAMHKQQGRTKALYKRAIPDCPVCVRKMSRTNASGVERFQCTGCSRFWVPYRSMAALLRMERTGLEVASPVSDRGFSGGASRQCGACGQGEVKPVEQCDFELEACTKCGGMLFTKGQMESLLPNTHEPERASTLAIVELLSLLIFFVLAILA